MLRKIRRILAILFFALVTLLFLDYTGTIHTWFGWMAKIQFLPALFALNVGVLLFLIALTLIFGRIYCSVICPLGVFQDFVSWLSGKRKKNRFKYSKALNGLRYVVLVLFAIAFALGISSIVALLAPYSAYGRIANTLFQPIYLWGNNLLAGLAERANSYAFYKTDIWLKSLPTLIVAVITLIIVIILAWRNGRTYCNTICPVGTILGFFAKYSWLKPVIDTSKCNSCGLCSRNCKASCINFKEHTIDYSRCVTCMDCVEKCPKGSISYKHPVKKVAASSTSPLNGVDDARRSFLTATAIVTTTSILKAQEKKVDGGLAVIEEKQIPHRNTPLTPPGSLSARHMAQYCTACQLCVSVCPNEVLRPSTNLMHFMQPEMSYERGYCRPECTRCSDVCPAEAIQPITKAEKSSIQIGHAVWIKANCVALIDGVDCGNCARHCPTGAIQMISSDASLKDAPKIPVVNTERCIGCGACENLCPARPFSAIYIEGHETHRII